MLGAAVDDHRIPRNPCDGVKLPKSKHADRGYLEPAKWRGWPSDERRPEVIRFLAYTGLRWVEMARCEVQDFDMLRRRVNVSRSVTESGLHLVRTHPQAGERRSVPFLASLTEELAALMARKGRDDLVLHQPSGATCCGIELPPPVLRVGRAKMPTRE